MSSVAYIIVHYNDTRWLLNILSIFKKRLEGDEVIVVDDSSNEISFTDLAQLVAPFDVKLVNNDFGKGAFKAFAKGCSETHCQYVSCWSADDDPSLGYFIGVRTILMHFPNTKLITVNATVRREGKYYERTLLPFDSYISPDYAVKMFKNGFARQLNLIGSVIWKQCVLDAWENGGMQLRANFDGMYFFHTVFKYGFINIGQHLVTYRAYFNGLGASSKFSDLQNAIEIHRKYYAKDYRINRRVIDSGIWETKVQNRSQIALRVIRKLPRFLRRIFFNWFYSYDERIEKL